jgi:transposase
LHHLDARATHDDTQISTVAETSEAAQLLMTIPGIGPLVATALVATIGEHWGLFDNGRALAAWLGLVLRQYSTGGKPRLLSVSKRGDVYLRQPFIVAMANKLARIAWAVMTTGKAFEAQRGALAKPVTA